MPGRVMVTSIVTPLWSGFENAFLRSTIRFTGLKARDLNGQPFPLHVTATVAPSGSFSVLKRRSFDLPRETNQVLLRRVRMRLGFDAVLVVVPVPGPVPVPV